MNFTRFNKPFISILIDIPDNYKLGASVGLIMVFLIIYIVLWVKANSLSKVRLKINNSVIDVKIGDIFKENDFKVIAFNEYFDEMDQSNIDEPPCFSCEKCGELMRPKEYKGVYGKDYKL